MHVLVLGGGYAGVTATRRLERELQPSARLTLVDRDDRHRLRHELHRLIRAPDRRDDIAVPYDALFDRATVVRGRVVGLDTAAGVATLADGTELAFDLGAVCLGARTAYYDLPGVEAHAVPLERVEDAATIRERLLARIDAGGGRAVVGGAGLTGVQVAGELAALAAERDAADAVEVVLLEQADSVAPGFPDHFADAVHHTLLEAGVVVRTGTRVTGATADAVELDAGRLAAELLVWTGGIRGPDALGDDRPTVPATLRLDDRTVVVGDAARIVDRSGAVLPATAQAAVAAAEVAARNLARLARHEAADGPFDPRLDRVEFTPRGWIVSVGDRTVAQVGPVVLRDRAALALKAAVGARYLAGVGALREAVGHLGDDLVGRA